MPSRNSILAPVLAAAMALQTACSETRKVGAYDETRGWFSSRVERVLNVGSLEGARQSIDEDIASTEYGRMLANPFIVQALIYPDEFFRTPPAADALPATLAVHYAHGRTNPIRRQLANALRALGEQYRDQLTSTQALPVDGGSFNGMDGSNHPDALDIFVEEGTPVRCIEDGIVLLAENGWQEGQYLSTSSYLGGNTVIVFHPRSQSFTRYAHLAEVSVLPGDFVPAGTVLGSVGHSGKNASLPGHGGHLHLDVSQLRSNGGTRGLTAKQIDGLLRSIRN